MTKSGVNPDAHPGYRDYFHKAYSGFPYRQAVTAQHTLLGFGRRGEKEKLWTSFAPYTLAIHCLNDTGENVAIGRDPVQVRIDVDTCEAYQGDKEKFAQDAVTALKQQAALYPDLTVRAMFYVPAGGLFLNTFDEKEGVNQLTLPRGSDQREKEKIIDDHANVFADFYEKGRDFSASWVDAVQEFQAQRVAEKSRSPWWSMLHNVDAEKAWPSYTRRHFMKSMGYYVAA